MNTEAIKSISFVFAGLLVVFVLPLFAHAREYKYKSIDFDITVQEDTTVLVREVQTFKFDGEYHSGWRSIPYKGIGSITDIKVYDGETGRILSYSTQSLDKTNPDSWGKYTFNRQNGAMNIEWYYNALDEIRSWTIEYTVHGSLGFLSGKDEFYWNLFTDYDVPVDRVYAFVTIPGNTYSPTDHVVTIYTSVPRGGEAEILNNRQFAFSAENIGPKEAVTIAVGWPLGIIDRGAFWRDWFLTNIVWLLSILIVLLTIFSGVWYWYKTEKQGKGRGTIIPEYEPPMHAGKRTPPAMAEMILREQITDKAWSATVVDLAVRGYLSVKEEDSMLSKFLGGFLASLATKDYLVSWVKEPDASLEDYEKTFMTLLGRTFSTKEMRRSPSKSQAMFKAMKKLKEELVKETENDTGLYEKPLSGEKTRGIIVAISTVAIVILVQFGFLTGILSHGINLLLSVSTVCIGGLWLFVRYEARLTHIGSIVREEWLGFKLYLETAERYRLANLTPQTFEKYLPYAIIFGVEKKWGKAFDSISMAPPSWYGSTSLTTSASTSFGSGGFSASAFSSSFSSSFSTAFASSGGGGGASGGGGGAGGGGGGGGGGAG